MSKNIPPSSFINLFSTITYDKTQTPNKSLDIWDAYILNQFNKQDMRNFTLHRVGPNDTWVSLARYYYDDDRLWWVIPMFNDIEDPFLALDLANYADLKELQILKPSKISALLLQSRQRKITNDHQTEADIKAGIEDG